jgi:hypothetical protein
MKIWGSWSNVNRVHIQGAKLGIRTKDMAEARENLIRAWKLLDDPKYKRNPTKRATVHFLQGIVDMEEGTYKAAQ